MKTMPRNWGFRVFAFSLTLALWSPCARAILPPERPRLENYDRRVGAAGGAAPAERQDATKQLRLRVPDASVDFDAVSGSPKWVRSRDGFLSGRGGQGRGVSAAAVAGLPATESHRALKAFLNEHSKLFGHGAEVLANAQLKREFVTAHSGLKTAVWQQELDGIPVFDGLLVAHTTKADELVSVSSGFISDPARAADKGSPARALRQAAPTIAAAQAVALAAQDVGESHQSAGVVAEEAQAEGAAKRQHFRAPGLNGQTEAQLVWLPLDSGSLRLCWEVILTSKALGEMFKIVLDAETGEALVRQNLTCYLTDATYRVYTSDSPSPFSPGLSTPGSTQPPTIARSLITLSALDTNASPNGWIDDGVNETRGNNVDAHTDRTDDDIPDLPRPQGSPNRVFDFPMDLSQSPLTYSSASVVQLFYWNNFMHDKLYELGFTEAAGNFQNSNFGRGGAGNDAVQADAQDGGGYNNANFSTPPDGSAGRMQMYLFNYPNPYRDGDFDAEVVCHEYTHGLSNRRVGHGVGISTLQSAGMGEGWSDFYALTLLSEAGDDVNGVYANGGYVTYMLAGLTQNYYFGIRRYPYCTDLGKNPLTFKDIDPGQASVHSGIPRNPIIGTTANEVHNMGEVWCVTLWEARASLIGKYGWAVGNQLMLQLVTDGMNLSPANPNFVQARDAILQADQVDTGGANRAALWTAFAKRGLGASATSPASSTASGVKEAFDVPDDLLVSPAVLWASGPAGGPFTPNPAFFTLTNTGASAVDWSLGTTASWLNASPVGGTLLPGAAAISVSIQLSDSVTNLNLGVYNALLWFTNQTSGFVQSRTFSLAVVGRNMFDDFDPGIDLSQWSSFGGVVGSTVLATNYGGSISGPNSLWFGDGGSRFATTMPINTSSGGTISFYLRLANGSSSTWEMVDLPDEGVVLEASTDSGTTWTVLGTYNTTAYYTWTAVSMPIPAVAQGSATLFRWRQLSNSGVGFDHWALDNVNVNSGPMAPTISSQPQGQDAIVGDDVLLSVVAYGSLPLSYQWRVNGGDISGATASTLEFTNVALGDAGTYSVFLSNSVGTLVSSDAVLTVNPPPPCVPPPAGIVSWWRGEGDASDALGAHPGSPSGGVTFAKGEVGQAFSFNGANAAVDLGNWFNLQTFSVALWVKPGASQPTYADIIDNNHSGSPTRSWVVQYQNTGLRFAWALFSSGGFGAVAFDLSANTWQYLVLTLDSNHVAQVYLNGQFQASTNLTGSIIYDGTQFLRLGHCGCGGRYFNGLLDEIDVYNRALTPSEIQTLYGAASSGKCVAGSAPVIVSQPASQTVFVGGNTSFSVTAAGSPPLSYQWAFNGANLAAATTTSLLLTNVQLSQAGTYTVLVSNAAGSLLSSNAVLTVNLVPPSILSQPFSQTAVVGSNVSFTVTATGTPPLSYQWLFNGAPLSGRTGKLLSLTGVQMSDAGTYSVAVTNPAGSVLSSNAVLTVNLQPICVPAPPGLVGWWRAEGNASDWAGAHNGALIGGATYAAGEVGQTFSLNGANAAVGLGSWFNLQTFSVTMWVNPAASQVNSADIIDNNHGGSPARSWTVEYANTGLHFAWTLFASGGAAVIPFDLKTNTWQCLALTVDRAGLAQVYLDGQAQGSATLAGAIYYDGTQFLRLGGWVGGGRYFTGLLDEIDIYNRALTASEVQGIYAAGPAGKCPDPILPSVTSQPSDQVVNVAATATFNVSAIGTQPLNYQWRCNSLDLPGATNSSLTLTNVQLSQAGSYSVLVSNSAGSVLSSNAVLTVNVIPPSILSQPRSQVAVVGSNATFSVTAAGSPPLNYQWNFNGIPLPGQTTASLRLFSVQMTDAGTYSVLVTNLGGSTLSSNALLTVNLEPFCITAPSGLVSWWRAEGNAFDQLGVNSGTLVGSVAYGSGSVGQGFVCGGNGSYVQLANSTNLQVQNLTVEAWVKRASASVTTGTGAGGGELFGYNNGGYAFGINNDGTLVFSKVGMSVVQTASGLVADTNFHHVAVTKSGSAVVFYVDGVAYPVAAYDPGFTFSSAPVIGALAGYGNNFWGTIDEFSIYNRGLSATEIQAIYAAGSAGKCLIQVPPTISAQPTNQSTIPGGTAAFRVTAAGTPPLSYQWRFNGVPLPGATSTSLSLTGVQMTAAGTYSVLVTNPGGSTLSSNAVLTVISLPPCTPPPSGLVSWWRAEGNATDWVGVHNGTLSGGAGFAAGEVGQAFSFNGANAAVDLGNWFNLQTFSVALWVKAGPSQPTYADIIDNNHSGSPARSWVVQYQNSGLRFAWAMFSTGGFGAVPFDLTANTWQYLTLTLDSNQVARVYLNGQLQGSTNLIGTLIYDGTQFLRLGRCGCGGRYFNGLLDEVDVYNRPLTASEIQTLYNAGAGGKCPDSNRSPVASNAAGATRQNIPMNISVEKLLLYASDPDGDPLSVSSVSAASTNGGPVVLNGDTITYTPSLDFLGLDRFTYSVSDGRGGSASAYVLLNVWSPDLPSGNMLPVVAIEGGYRVGFAGIPGRSYSVQRATELGGPWITLAHVPTDSNGIGTFDDTTAPPDGAFYRTTYP